MTGTGWTLRSIFAEDLSVRSSRSEILDDHESDHAQVALTHANLERINVLLSGIRRMCRTVLFRDTRRRDARTVSIVDLGCGGGDLVYWLAGQLLRRGIQPRIFGIDNDPRVVAIAKKRCAAITSVKILEGDAADLSIVPGPVDWIVSNHFLHHLDSSRASHLLTEAARMAEHGVIMNDLIRGRAALLAFHLICRLLMPRGHTAHDGLVSILRSFSASELLLAVGHSGIALHARVVRSGIGHRAIVIIPKPRTCPKIQ